MKKRRARDRSKGRPSPLDLEILFLTTMGNETPEAIQDLFATWSADEWARKYQVRAKWLADFASRTLRMNWRIAGQPEEFRRAVALTAWRGAIARRRGIIDALDEAAIKVSTVFDDETIDKRDPQTHCRWLVLWLFKRMADSAIAANDRIAIPKTVAGKRAELAKALEIELPHRRGRPKKIYP